MPTEDAGTKLLEQFDFPDDPANEPVEAPPAPEAKSTPEPEAKPAHPSWLTRAAKQVGIDDAEMASMPSSDLEKAVTILAQSRAEDRRIQDAQTSRQRDEQGRFVKQEKPEEAPAEFSLKDLGLDSSKWTGEETTEQLLSSIAKPLMDQIKELKAKLSQIEERDTVRERNAQYDRLDNLFNEQSTVFGKGNRQKLKPGPELSRRKAVIGEMAAIQQADPGVSFEECFERATANLFGKPHAPEAPEVDPKGYQNGSTIRPTVRQTKPQPKGDAAAMKAVEALMKERSMSAPTTEFDELPD